MRSQWTNNSLFKKELTENVSDKTVKKIKSPGDLRDMLYKARLDGAEILATGNSPTVTIKPCDNNPSKRLQRWRPSHATQPIETTRDDSNGTAQQPNQITGPTNLNTQKINHAKIRPCIGNGNTVAVTRAQHPKRCAKHALQHEK